MHERTGPRSVSDGDAMLDFVSRFSVLDLVSGFEELGNSKLDSVPVFVELGD